MFFSVTGAVEVLLDLSTPHVLEAALLCPDELAPEPPQANEDEERRKTTSPPQIMSFA